MNSFNKRLSKFGFILCWVCIIIISGIYAGSTATPWKWRVFKTIEMPRIDPLVFVNTHSYAIPSRIRNFYWRTNGLNKELIEKDKNFYSALGRESYYTTFYRPDYENYLSETIQIMLYRLFTFLGLVLFLYLFAQILKTVSEGAPFQQSNQHRLFYMGIIWFLLPIIRTLHSTILASFLRYDPSLLGYDVLPTFRNLWLVFIGISIILSSAVFKEMTTIYEEQKLTV